MIGTSIATDLTAAGKKGISIHSSYDFWTPSRHYQAFHGGLRILTESASARLASPIEIRREDLQRVLSTIGEEAPLRGVIHAAGVIDDGLLGEIYYARGQWLRRRRLPGRVTFTERNLSGGGRNAGQFHWVHAMAIDKLGNVYTGEVDNAKRIQKFKLTSDALK